MHDPAQGGADLAVGELAALAGVTVRTLHHYDEIGLLRPSARGTGGRRAYAAADAARLARILTYRALDLPLDRIAALLDGDADEAEQLRDQLSQLDARIAHLTAIRDHVRTTLEANEMSITLTPEERLEVFGDDDPAVHEAEARHRWGDTDAWHQSHARTRRYSGDDWRAIRAEQEAITEAFAAALRAGEPSGGPAAMAVAERARRFIDERFYDLSPAAHRGLAELYVSDDRFAAYYDRHEPGLSAYVAAAIHANADRSG